jgi:hypothetical protein
MATINKTILNREVKKLLFNKDIQNLAYQRAFKEFERIKKQALREFNQHPVTKELEEGVGASNISKTLPGTKSDANLFSFIGFAEGANPTQEVRQILEQEIDLNQKPTVRNIEKGIQFNFKVLAPTLKAIEAATPLPWENGRSWVKGIERGISGLGYYLSGRFKSPEPSRSGGGIQSNYKVRKGSFVTVEYLGAILRDLKEKLKQ